MTTPKTYILLEANREGYAVSQIRRTMTVGELQAYLDQFDEDTPIYLSHDRGYTYGGIREWNFEYKEDEDEDE